MDKVLQFIGLCIAVLLIKVIIKLLIAYPVIPVFILMFAVMLVIADKKS